MLITAVDLGVASAADTDVEAVDDFCNDVVCFTPATVIFKISCIMG